MPMAMQGEIAPEMQHGMGDEKAGGALRSSRAVPHPSTNRALRRLTSEFGRDPVHSTGMAASDIHVLSK